MKKTIFNKITLGCCIYLVQIGFAWGQNPAWISENFEGEFDEKNIARGWEDNSGWADLDVHYERETANPHSGKAAQKIVCTRYATGSTQFLLQAPVGIEKGKIYRLRIWARGSVATGQLDLDIRKRETPWTSYLTQSFPLTGEWQPFEILEESHATDPGCCIMVRFDGVGEVVLDDMEYEEMDPSKLTEAGAAHAGKKGNLLPNGTFEMGSAGWGCLIRDHDYFHGEQAAVHGKYAFAPEAAYDGKMGFRLILPEGGIAYFSSHPMALIPMREYTVSCWARANEGKAEMDLGLAGGNESQSKTVVQSVVLNESWQRVHATVKAPLVPKGLLSVHAIFRQPGQYDLDNVQVEEGGEVTPFYPRDGIDHGFGGLPANGAIQQGEKLAAKLIRYAPKKDDLVEEKDLTARVVDWTEKEVLKTKIALAQGSSETPILLPTRQAGVFRAELTDAGGGMLAQCIYAVLPSGLSAFKPGPADQSFFGTHISEPTDEELDFAWATGSRWLRLHPPLVTKWMVVEDKKGEFVWHDDLIKRLRDKGFKILGSLDTTAVWASQHPELGFGWCGNKATSYPAKDIKDWENYVRQMVTHYAGMIDDWEVWNEPNAEGFLKVDREAEKGAEYVRLLSAAYKVLHEANPKGRLVGGVGCGLFTEWSEKVASLGGYQKMDVLSFHCYSALPNITAAFFQEVSTVRGLGHEQRPNMSVWNTESGVNTPLTFYREDGEGERHGEGVENQAVWVALSYVGNMAAGVERMFFYTSSASGLPIRTSCTALREWDGAWRPAAVAAYTTARLLDGAKLLKAPSKDESVQEAIFSKDGYRITCAWNNYDVAAKKTTLSVPAKAMLLDMMGNITQSNQERATPLGAAPMWIIERL